MNNDIICPCGEVIDNPTGCKIIEEMLVCTKCGGQKTSTKGRKTDKEKIPPSMSRKRKPTYCYGSPKDLFPERGAKVCAMCGFKNACLEIAYNRLEAEHRKNEKVLQQEIKRLRGRIK